jgi:hypothetical protein
MKKKTDFAALELLADKVIGAFQKIADHKEEIAQLRKGFKSLKSDETIRNCHTWSDFCEIHLHHTKRAVNMMLADSVESRHASSAARWARLEERRKGRRLTVDEATALYDVATREERIKLLHENFYKQSCMILAHFCVHLGVDAMRKAYGERKVCNEASGRFDRVLLGNIVFTDQVNWRELPDLERVWQEVETILTFGCDCGRCHSPSHDQRSAAAVACAERTAVA